MLYPLQTISEERVPIPPLPGAGPPAQRFLTLIRSVSLLFDQTSNLLPAAGGRLTLLYRNIAYLLHDVVDNAGGLAAALSALWPLRFYGVTEDRETAEWTISTLDAKTALVGLRSVSGKPFDHLEGLGIQMDLPNAALAAALEELCAAIPFLRPCAVIPSGGTVLLEGSSLLAAGIRPGKPVFLSLLGAPVLRPAAVRPHSAAQGDLVEGLFGIWDAGRGI